MRPTTACDLNDVFDLSALLHPEANFDHPHDVVVHPHLSLADKRAILASWVSDACAVASCPELRAPSGLRRPVNVDEIFDALHKLDNGHRQPPGGKSMRVSSTSRVMVA